MQKIIMLGTGHRLQMMLDKYISTVETSNQFMIQTLNQIKAPFL